MGRNWLETRFMGPVACTTSGIYVHKERYSNRSIDCHLCVCLCPEAVRLVELLGHILPEGVARTFPEESKNSKNTSKVSSRQRSLRFEHPLASRTHAPAQTIVGITLGSLCRETDRQLQNTGMHGTLTYHMNHRQLKQTCLSMLTSVCSPSA